MLFIGLLCSSERLFGEVEGFRGDIRQHNTVTGVHQATARLSSSTAASPG
jgi:hypothetical protein